MSKTAAERISAGTEQLLDTLFNQSIAAYFHSTLITSGYCVSNASLMNWTCAGHVNHHHHTDAAAGLVTKRYILCWFMLLWLRARLSECACVSSGVGTNRGHCCSTTVALWTIIAAQDATDWRHKAAGGGLLEPVRLLPLFPRTWKAQFCLFRLQYAQALNSR